MNKGCVGIMIVEEKDIVHTTYGGEWKMSRLVRRDDGVELVEFDSRGADKMVTRNRRSILGLGRFQKKRNGR